MAISFVDSTATAADGDVSATAPSGLASGDVLVAFNLIRSGTATTTTPSGWTQIDVRIIAASTCNTSMYYRIAGGSEPASYTFDINSATARHVVYVSAYRGVDNTTPIVDFSNRSQASGDGTPDTATVTVTDAAQWIVAAVGITSSVSGSFTAPTGMTEREDFSHGSGSTWAYGTIADSDGPESTGDYTKAFTATNTHPYTAWAVVLGAAGGGGGPTPQDSCGILIG